MPYFDSPKPVVKRHHIIQRLCSWKSSGIGLTLVFAGIFVLNMDLSDVIKTSTSILLFGLGAVGLGYKEKSK